MKFYSPSSLSQGCVIVFIEFDGNTSYIFICLTRDVVPVSLGIFS